MQQTEVELVEKGRRAAFRSVFKHRMKRTEVFMAAIIYYLLFFLLITFVVCPAILYNQHTKKTHERQAHAHTYRPTQLRVHWLLCVGEMTERTCQRRVQLRVSLYFIWSV